MLDGIIKARSHDIKLLEEGGNPLGSLFPNVGSLIIEVVAKLCTR